MRNNGQQLLQLLLEEVSVVSRPERIALIPSAAGAVERCRAVLPVRCSSAMEEVARVSLTDLEEQPYVHSLPQLSPLLDSEWAVRLGHLQHPAEDRPWASRALLETGHECSVTLVVTGINVQVAFVGVQQLCCKLVVAVHKTQMQHCLLAAHHRGREASRSDGVGNGSQLQTPTKIPLAGDVVGGKEASGWARHQRPLLRLWQAADLGDAALCPRKGTMEGCGHLPLLLLQYAVLNRELDQLLHSYVWATGKHGYQPSSEEGELERAPAIAVAHRQHCRRRGTH
mmetsp:Transcript_20691/g.79341  ORF Transcript_20691/g.79341 Transcript_20691/m.79341 type:complete len:284 (-) Transcript_20691:415-1266(-)